MKFTGSVEINQPLQMVADLFADPDNLAEYQDGFVRRELVSGSEGEDGAVSKLYYTNRGREMELTETIVANRLPNSLEAHYHHQHMDNTLRTTFTAIDESRTRYQTEGEYLAFRGLVPRLMARLFPGMFAKQAQKWLDNFKTFAESQHGD
jgi:hypothetical protein